MNTFLTILLVLAAIIALLRILALFLKKDHYVKREIIINAPRQEVNDFLKHLENQEKFNKWAKAGAEWQRNTEYRTPNTEFRNSAVPLASQPLKA